MEWYEILIGILLVITSIAIVILVLMQQSRRAGLSGAISGGAETFFGKNKSNSLEAKLSRFTKILGVVFFVVVLFCTFLLAFMVSR
ncbi:MAG: preprotein translocase subunit SecG [Clostridia bacterium]|nr:preprotein translocase subunit SecG [Clostridia bacterium]